MATVVQRGASPSITTFGAALPHPPRPDRDSHPTGEQERPQVHTANQTTSRRRQPSGTPKEREARGGAVIHALASQRQPEETRRAWLGGAGAETKPCSRHANEDIQACVSITRRFLSTHVPQEARVKGSNHGATPRNPASAAHAMPPCPRPERADQSPPPSSPSASALRAPPVTLANPGSELESSGHRDEMQTITACPQPC